MIDKWFEKFDNITDEEASNPNFQKGVLAGFNIAKKLIGVAKSRGQANHLIDKTVQAMTND